jgi:hypothetical protein
MSSTQSESELESAMDETLYLLKRWRFAVSTSGFLWVQPVGPKMSPEELAGFIALLKRGCGAPGAPGFPQSILFDFNEVEVVGAQWSMVESLLVDFARGIGARYRVTATHKRPASAVLLYRRDGDPVPSAPARLPN